MKVCHVGTSHRRYDTRIFYKECSSLAKAGYDVTFLIADDGLSEETKNDVKILPVQGVPRVRFLKRFFKYNAVMLNKALELDADVYHLHEWELLPWAKELKKRKKRVIFDCHENFIGAIKDAEVNFIKLNSLLLLYRYCEAFISNYVDVVVCVTPSLLELMKNHCSNVIMLTNYPIPLQNKIVYSEMFIKPTFVFAGGISEQWNHEKILQALDGIDIDYLLMGNVTDDYLKRMQKYPNWKKVKFLGCVSHEEVQQQMHKCVCGFSILTPSRNTFGMIGTLGNTKIFEQMQAGLPVICTNFELWRGIIEKWKCGLCVNPYSVNEISEAIRLIINSPDEAKRMGDNGKKAVDVEFNWGIEEKKLLNLYKEFEV